MRGVLVMTMASISPSGREVPPAESLRRRAKVVPPKFRLEAAAPHLESPMIFSRLNVTIYQNMGTGGGPRRPQPSGVWRALVGCAHQVGPLR